MATGMEITISRIGALFLLFISSANVWLRLAALEFAQLLELDGVASSLWLELLFSSSEFPLPKL
jgi:hypothetical protein